MTPIVERQNRKNQNFKCMYNKADSAPCIRIGILALSASELQETSAKTAETDQTNEMA